MSAPIIERMDAEIPRELREKACTLWIASDFNEAIVARIAPESLKGSTQDFALVQMNMIGALLNASASPKLVEKLKAHYIELEKQRMLPRNADKDEPSYWEGFAADFIAHAREVAQVHHL